MWMIFTAETPGKHSQPSKAIFQPLISGIKSLHVSFSQLFSYLNGMWVLQGIIREGGWTSLPSNQSRQIESVSGVSGVSKPELYSCELQGQEATFKVLYLLLKGPKRSLEGLKILACILMPTGSSFSVLDHYYIADDLRSRDLFIPCLECPDGLKSIFFDF